MPATRRAISAELRSLNAALAIAFARKLYRISLTVLEYGVSALDEMTWHARRFVSGHGGRTMPVLLWLLGVPLSLVIILLLMGVL